MAIRQTPSRVLVEPMRRTRVIRGCQGGYPHALVLSLISVVTRIQSSPLAIIPQSKCTPWGSVAGRVTGGTDSIPAFRKRSLCAQCQISISASQSTSLAPGPVARMERAMGQSCRSAPPSSTWFKPRTGLGPSRACGVAPCRATSVDPPASMRIQKSINAGDLPSPLRGVGVP